MFNISDEKCAFNVMYKLNDEAVINGRGILFYKRKLAKIAAEKINSNYDFISGIPNTGDFYAKLIKDFTKIPYAKTFRKTISKRTLKEKVLERVTFYRTNLEYVATYPLESKILLIDEAVFTGVTVESLYNFALEKLNKNFDFLILSPRVTLTCPWGHVNSVERVDDNFYRKKSKIIHIKVEEFHEVFPPSNFCSLCFTG